MKTPGSKLIDFVRKALATVRLPLMVCSFKKCMLNEFSVIGFIGEGDDIRAFTSFDMVAISPCFGMVVFDGPVWIVRKENEPIIGVWRSHRVKQGGELTRVKRDLISA